MVEFLEIFAYTMVSQIAELGTTDRVSCTSSRMMSSAIAPHQSTSHKRFLSFDVGRVPYSLRGTRAVPDRTMFFDGNTSQVGTYVPGSTIFVTLVQIQRGGGVW